MNPRLARLAALLALATLAGCAPQVFATRLLNNQGFTRPVERMSILTAGQFPRTSGIDAGHLAAAYRDLAARCGIDAQIAVQSESGLIRAPEGPPRPLEDTYLIIARSGGRITTTRTGHGAIVSQRQTGSRFTALLQDVPTGREVWRIEFDATFGDWPGERTGPDLAQRTANAVFARMALDGVLRQCAGAALPTR